MRLDARLAVTVVVVTIGFVVADLLWSRNSNVSLDLQSYIEFMKVIVAITGLYWIMVFVERRVAGDHARIGRFIAYTAGSTKTLIWNGGLFIPLGFASVYFMYLIAATDRPLMDESLALIDARLGFDWLAFLDVANTHPLIAKVLVFAYHSVGPQIPLLFLLLAFTGQSVRLTETIAILAVSSALTAAFMAWIPAAGAYAYFQPIAADYSNFTPRAGMWHYSELMKLRSGEPFSLLVTKAEGLATFPSYHTQLGIFVVYALRNTRLLVWPAGVLNAIMIVSTLPEGGHHLFDVVAGIAVGLLTIACVRAVQWRRLDLAEPVSI
jgi:membrane-associated phospholipid phosphatase